MREKFQPPSTSAATGSGSQAGIGNRRSGNKATISWSSRTRGRLTTRELEGSLLRGGAGSRR
eukprot:750651-Hanusia_phi.AAC.1